jgi:predicted phage terminase large subunit-like protein
VAARPERIEELRSRVQRKLLLPENRDLIERLQRKREPIIGWAKRANPRFRWFDVNRHAAEIFMRVVSGEIRRLIVLMPPRHGKSETFSRMLPAYYLHRFPERWVGLASYGADLAFEFSRRARAIYVEGGGQLDMEAVRLWTTPQGGGMWAAGVGGPITGRGAHLAIIDDPVKNEKDVASERFRQQQWEWYDSTLQTRLEPDGAVVLVMTRWHESDLAGMVMENAAERNELWYLMRFDALHEPVDEVLPENVLPVEDWREEGDALCPERYDEEALERIRGSSSSYTWSSLYQQRPVPREGNQFKLEWFGERRVPAAPRGAHVYYVRSWDEAATENGGDYTVGVLGAVDVLTGLYYVVDVVRGQWGPGKRDRIMVATAERDAEEYGVVIQIGQKEGGASGKEREIEFVTMMSGFNAHVLPASGSKELRAENYAAQWEVGNYRMVDLPWSGSSHAVFRDEHLAFPNGAHDDQVDAAAFGFEALAKLFRAHRAGQGRPADQFVGVH